MLLVAWTRWKYLMEQLQWRRLLLLATGRTWKLHRRSSSSGGKMFRRCAFLRLLVVRSLAVSAAAAVDYVATAHHHTRVLPNPAAVLGLGQAAQELKDCFS